jgi:hypothetical protein
MSENVDRGIAGGGQDFKPPGDSNMSQAARRVALPAHLRSHESLQAIARAEALREPLATLLTKSLEKVICLLMSSFGQPGAIKRRKRVKCGLRLKTCPSF